MPTSSSLGSRLLGVLTSAPNWIGLALASIALVLKGFGLLGNAALPVAVLGYAAGFVVGGLWLGFPTLSRPGWEALQFSDDGDTRPVSI